MYVILTLQTFNCFAQNIGINTTGNTPNSKAILDIDVAPGNNKGLLIPRMSTAERNAITAPIPESLLIYNTTTTCFEAWNQTTATWVAFGCIGCQLPGVFTANAASSITATTINANWTTSVGATNYFLDVSTVSNFATFVSGYNNLNVGNVTTYGLTGLTCATTYYYRLRAANACGTCSNSNAILVTTSACFTCISPFTDPRDGQAYNTVQIGSQCWFAQNLNYGAYTVVGINQTNNGVAEKYCMNISGVLDPTCPMGGLYQWNELMNYAASCNGSGPPPNDKCPVPVQGMCPLGWHVPSYYEFVTMLRAINGSTGFPYDLSVTGWIGTDEGGKLKQAGTVNWISPNTGATNTTGFTALPNGYSFWTGELFSTGYGAYFWSSQNTGGGTAYYRELSNANAQVYGGLHGVGQGFSCRCVKD